MKLTIILEDGGKSLERRALVDSDTDLEFIVESVNEMIGVLEQLKNPL